MDEFDSASTTPFPRPQPARQGGGFESEPNFSKPECVSITHILVTDVAGLRHMPAGCYVAVQIDGKITETSNKSVPVGEDKMQWDEEITLPSERSSVILFRVYASSELEPRLGNGELLFQFEITVGEVLDGSELRQHIVFLASNDNVLLFRPSLRINVERRICNASESVPRLDSPETDKNSKLAMLTNAGHRALLCYRWRQDQKDLDEAIVCFERSRDLCPPNHTHRSSVLFDLATAVSFRCKANDANPDLDVPITLYQEAFQLRPEGHPDHYTTMLDLGLALLTRFQRRCDNGDRTMAKDMLSRVFERSPVESYTHRAASLGLKETKIPSPRSRIVAPGASYNAGGGVIDEELIRRGWAMLPDLSTRDPRRPVLLACLAEWLQRRSERRSHLEDMNQSISMFEEADKLTPNAHPDKPGRLIDLGSSLLDRFKRLGNLGDINKSVSVLERAMRLTPNDHPHKPTLLSNLGSSLTRRFERLNHLEDINKSVLMFEEAARLTLDTHPDKPDWLNNLGTSLRCRFERLGNLEDISKSVSILEQAVHLTPNGHPDEPTRLSNLGTSLYRRFEQLGNPKDINKSISVLKEAVHLTPDVHPEKSAQLNNLGTSLVCRFERLGNLEDINASISMLEEAVRLSLDGHPNKPGWLNNLGNSLYRRFERLDKLEDINRSISMLEEAMRLTPDGHSHKQLLLNSLGSSLHGRFERLGNIKDINKSISLKEAGVRLTPDDHPNKSGWLSNIGTSLYRRFEQLGNLEDINKSISMLEEAVRLTPNTHPDKPARLSNLGNSLSYRFGRLDNLEDINKSISVLKEAVHLLSDSHPQKPAHLHDLGSSLARRFERLGNLEDINISISILEEAVRLTPHSHPHKPGWLSSLGNSLYRRFERLDDIEDINKAILTLEEAAYLTPNAHRNKPARLNNLGNSLSRRFGRFSNLEDINKSISMFSEAVRLIPDGHPDKPGWLTNLGGSLAARFTHSADPSDLSAATFHFSVAARTPAGPPSTRFDAARRWISSSHREANSEALLDAYTISVSLIPELAWLGLPLAERHRLLRDAADTARDAAAIVAKAGFPERAVEWHEQGRSVVWGQFLQLRTPGDRLRAAHPALADRFQSISLELERAGTRGNFASNNDSGASTPSLERETQRHHELAISREKLLAEIRSLPGFDRFLLPKTAQQLAASAHSGPVVYLNASKQQCDALVVMQDRGTVLHIPLPGISYPLVEGMQKLLHDLLKQKRLIISRDEISALIPFEENSTSYDLLNMLFLDDGRGRSNRAVKHKSQRTEGYTPDEIFRLVLACLWESIVKPVLDALGFSTPPSEGEKLSRLFWCPTGPFAFLPIHAAGIYHPTKAGTKVSDFVISSYTPTLSALAPSPRVTTSSNIRLVAVPQPLTDGQTHLASVKEEIDHIRTLSAGSPFVTFQESHGTVEIVLENMEGSNSDWVHFACHGVQDPDNPLDSGLCLADSRRLKLSDVIRLSRPRGGLAFLSACQTAQGDEELSDESVHLAAGMLLAGYDGVIATMWAIMDPDAPKVTKDVYGHLFRDGKIPDTTEAAEALHYAVRHLRDSGAGFFSWVPFIHVGI